MKIEFLSLLILLISCQYDSRSVIIRENVQVSHQNSSTPHAEVHLAANPLNPKELMAVSMMYKDSAGPDYHGIYSSIDGGESWHFREIQTDHLAAVDPWIVHDGQAIYYTHLPGNIHVTEDLGLRWKDYKVSLGEPYSLDFIKILSQGSSTVSNFFLVATNNIPIDSIYMDPITVVKFSADSVSDFIHLFPKKINFKNGTPVIHPSGYLLVPYYELLDLERNILDHNPIWISRVNAETLESEDIRTDLLGGEPTLVVNEAYRNRVHLTGFTRFGAGFKIQYAHSDDGGYTWTEPIFIEDFDRSPGSMSLTVSAAVSNEGILGIMWADHRTDPENKEYGMYFMYSDDGGLTFSKSHLISTIASPYTEKNMQTLIGNSGRSVGDRFWSGGDYSGLVATGDRSFQAMWVDSRTGVAQIWTTKISIE